MALTVEVAGYGICQDVNCAPYPLMVICVQQEAFQAWTVYRRYNTFIALSDQLKSVYPMTLPVPLFNLESNFSHESLENCRIVLDKWLRTVASNSMILRTQSMYQFLCVEANQSPPNIQIRWRDSSNGSFDEMDMDDMFDRQGGSGGGNGTDYDADEEVEVYGHTTALLNDEDPNHQSKSYSGSHNSKNNKRDHWSNHHNHRAGTSNRSTNDEDDEKDGLDIQSISHVQEAEFLYDREEEENKAKQRQLGSTPTTIFNGINNNNNNNNNSSNSSSNNSSLTTTNTNDNDNSLAFNLQVTTSTTPTGDIRTEISSANAPKKTINLDSFHIIKVIGKGQNNYMKIMYRICMLIFFQK